MVSRIKIKNAQGSDTPLLCQTKSDLTPGCMSPGSDPFVQGCGVRSWFR